MVDIVKLTEIKIKRISKFDSDKANQLIESIEDKIELKHPPAILIGTPGRIADHMRRKIIQVDGIKTFG